VGLVIGAFTLTGYTVACVAEIEGTDTPISPDNNLSGLFICPGHVGAIAGLTCGLIMGLLTVVYRPIYRLLSRVGALPLHPLFNLL
jgi:hypothetical protein